MKSSLLLGAVSLALFTTQIHQTASSRHGSNRAAFFEKQLRLAKDILDRVPLIDGHNEFPWSLRSYAQNQIDDLNINDLSIVSPWNETAYSHTDINRLRRGKLGAQFWSAFIPCDAQYKDATVKYFEQIDVIHRMVASNPTVFELVTSAQGIEDAFNRSKIGSLIGVEAGHSIGGSLGVLRTMYQMGARYLTLTHSCPTPWADNSQMDDPGNTPLHGGLTDFGKKVVMEMNRLGMMVDLSHVSRNTMRDALNVTRAPVIFSHSGAYALCNSTRNVPDDILQLVTDNGGVVMVTFYTLYITCSNYATLEDVADHIEYIRDVSGVDHVGIGANFNGITLTPTGLKDVSEYPYLFAELLSRGWSETDLAKVAGQNLLRVFRKVEEIRDEMSSNGTKPYDEWIPQADLPQEALNCSSGAMRRLFE